MSIEGNLLGESATTKHSRTGGSGRVITFGGVLFGKVQLVEAKAVDAVDEFVSRLFEEMDFENEAENVKKFNSLYGPKGVKMDDVVNGAAGNSEITTDGKVN